MARLPERIRTQVQGMGRRDVTGEMGARLAGANAMQAVGQTAFDIHQINEEARQNRLNDQVRDASLSMAENAAEFESRYAGRDYIPTDELPEDLEVRRTRQVVGEDGQIIEQPREEVPAYEVMPTYSRQQMRRNAEAAASNIEDEEIRAEWLRDTNLKIDEQYAESLGRARQQQREFLDRKTEATLKTAIRDRRFGAAAALAQDFSDPVARQRATEMVEKAEVEDKFNLLIIDPDAHPHDIEDAIQLLEDPDQDLPLSHSERIAKANALRSNLQRVDAAQIAHDERETQRLVSNTWLLIDEADASVDEAYVEGLFERGAINGQVRTSMNRAIRENREQLIRREAISVDLDRIAAAGYGIDPKDSDMREAVDERFKELAESTGDVWGSAERIMEDFKVVPSEIQGMFRSANRADAPQLAQAAELLLTAQDYAPTSLRDIPDSDINFISNVAANMRLGMDSASAVEATRRYEQMTPQEREAKRRMATEMRDGNRSRLQDQLKNSPHLRRPGWNPFRSQPEPGMIMQSEYDMYVERYLPQSGYDISVAQSRAFTELQKHWSATDINGDWRIMKNMPQAPTDQIRSLISTEYQSNLSQLSEAYGEQIGADRIRIYSDTLTELQQLDGDLTSYVAYAIIDEENDVIHELPRFTWDPEAAAESRRDEILEQGRKLRERNIMLREDDSVPTPQRAAELRGY